MNISEDKLRQMIQMAFDARDMAYTPYSNFKVGAALLSKEGFIYMGCNIENASYSITNCAERTALFKAVSEGVHEFKAIAIVGGPDGQPVEEYCPPCGVCRQALSEFCEPEEFEVILAINENEYKVYKLEELLPFGFSL